MSSPFGSLDVASFFAKRELGLESLGVAYLALLATVVLTAVAFRAARNSLVVSPNRGSRDYAGYVSWMLAALLIAIVLENELLPAGTAVLHYALVPQLVLLMTLHIAVARRQEPWLVTLAGSSVMATIVVGAVLSLGTSLLGPPYWIALLVLAGLFGFLWLKAVSTQRAFVNASSIYLTSKETLGHAAAPQTPWLGLPQWVALVAASAALGVANSLLRGRALEEIPVFEVASSSGLLLGVTALICAVPAVGYWLARKTWMPELTRLAWLAWIVVAFALTYGNYLNRLSQA